MSGAADEIPPGRPGAKLPPPHMTEPMRGCDGSVEVTGVFDGAVVTIDRSSGAPEVAGFDRNRERFTLSRPLVEDEELRVRQEVANRCERPAVSSGPSVVGKARPVAAPQVLGPLCAGATMVRVVGVRPGAIVHLAANKVVYDGTVPSGQTWIDCRIPPLTDDPVGATQELCGVTSPPAVPVSVDPHEDNVPAPTIVPPLTVCTGAVSLTKAHPGALVQVFARVAGIAVPISDQVIATTGNLDVAVQPLLIEGQEVMVRQWACSAKSADSGSEVVQPHGVPKQPEVVGPLLTGDTTVGVRGVDAGALVDVYSLGADSNQREFLGTARARALHPITEVGTNRPLVVEEQVIAIHRLCERSSRPSAPARAHAVAGFGPRPFYIVGHNPNTIGDATKAVNDGANALEPDVQVYSKHPDQLCINHGKGGSKAPSLVSYLQGLHKLAAKNANLALVVFDCKDPVTSPDHGFELLSAIREHLTFDNDLNIIISIGHSDHGGFFDRIVDLVGPREGLMVDAENDPGAVANYFTRRGVDHQGYGNGISFLNSVIGPYYRYTLEDACGDRAGWGRPKFIYVWTVNSHAEIREYIDIGVDGAITDDVNDLLAITQESRWTSVIRYARRDDNPFRPANFAYGLHMHTADKWMAGTDANVTFTITGTKGTASKTVDTSLVNRMESDDWNSVTIQSDDLGKLKKMTVQRDNQGNGPDWFLDSIEVRSARFGVSGVAVFDRWIDSTAPFNAPIV